MRGNHEVLEYFIDYGADYRKKDKNGLTPLALAIKKKQLKCEWVVRRLSSTTTLQIFFQLGLQRLKEKRCVVDYFYI